MIQFICLASAANRSAAGLEESGNQPIAGFGDRNYSWVWDNL